MVQIVAGDTGYVQLPDDHLIKKFCKKHKISDFYAQNDLMDLINNCILLAITEMVDERLKNFKEVADAREDTKEEIVEEQNQRED